MLTRPEELPDSVVARSLREAWDLAVVDIEYAPVGFGSYHWRVAADNGERLFVTIDDLERKRRDRAGSPDEPRRRLSAALATARSLRDAGLAFVIAPRRCRSGDILHTVDDRFAVALYPHVAGHTYSWGPYPSRRGRLAVLDLLVALHAAPEPASRRALVDDFTIPHRDQLIAALDDLGGPWDAGPFGEPARKLLDMHADAVAHALGLYDQLAARVASRADRMVLTHGEPHRANTITTANGVVLIDWDTALVAPLERDLWALADEDPRILADYADRTGTTSSVDAVDLYRLRWNLTETSIYIEQFRQAHDGTEDTLLAWRSLTRSLDAET